MTLALHISIHFFIPSFLPSFLPVLFSLFIMCPQFVFFYTIKIFCLNSHHLTASLFLKFIPLFSFPLFYTLKEPNPSSTPSFSFAPPHTHRAGTFDGNMCYGTGHLNILLVQPFLCCNFTLSSLFLGLTRPDLCWQCFLS